MKKITKIAIAALLMVACMPGAAQNNDGVQKAHNIRTITIGLQQENQCKMNLPSMENTETIELMPGYSITRVKHDPAFMSPSNTRIEADVCKVSYEISADGYQPSYLKFISADGEEYGAWWFGYEEAYGMEKAMEVPAGVYDVYASFSSRTEEVAIIKEQLNITQDTSIVFDTNEATHEITFSFTDKDGNDFILDKTRPIDEEPWSEVVAEGNTSKSMYTTYIILKNYGALMTFGVMASYEPESNPIPPCKIKTTPHSDRITEAVSRVDLCKDGNIYANALVNTDATVTELSNIPENYQLISESIERSLSGKESGLPQYAALETYDMIENQYKSGYSAVSNTVLPADAPVRVYVNSPKPTSDFYMLFKPGILDDVKTVHHVQTYDYGDGQTYTQEWDETVESKVTGVPEYVSNDGSTIYLSIGMQGRNLLSQTDELDKENYFFPGYDAFSFDNTQKGIKFGESAPVFVLPAFNYYNEWQQLKFTSWTPVEYKGILGGTYGSTNVNATIEYNDEVICDNFLTIDGDLQSWQNGSHDENGKWKAQYEYIGLVDGMASSNKTKIQVDQSLDDWTAPTLTMLNLVDASGLITNRFENSHDAILQFSAGDFNTQPDFSFDCKQANITVEYTPYGQTSWSTLNSVMEAGIGCNSIMGYLYTAGLGEVNVASANHWYDLRITLVDENGNCQQQVISPAFRLENITTTEIQEIAENEGCNDNPQAYDIMGRKASDNAKGIIIVNGKKVLVK